MENCESTHYHSSWRQVIGAMFEPAMAFFFPIVHGQVDWSRKVTFMDRALRKVLPHASTDNMRVNKLVKVWLKNGQSQVLFIHMEVQNQRRTGFARRIFRYHFKIVEQMGDDVITLIILGDEHPHWRPGFYQYRKMGVELSFKYPTVKLWDYLSVWHKLEANLNPMAIVVMAHLKAKQIRKDPEKKLVERFHLVKEMRRRGYDQNQQLQLMRFIGGILYLPETRESQFWQDLKEMQDPREVEIMWYIERVFTEEGEKKGRKLGRKESVKETLYRLIGQKFGSIPEWAKSKISLAETDQLQEWVIQTAIHDNLEQALT